jgi:hypothetical protein
MLHKRAWIHADQTKGKKAIAVLLNADAMGVIKAQIEKDLTPVFYLQG